MIEKRFLFKKTMTVIHYDLEYQDKVNIKYASEA